MANRSSWSPPSYGVLYISILLASIIVNTVIPTPNATGGGGIMLVFVFLLSFVFKVAIDFILSRWRKLKSEKQDEKRIS